MLDQLLDVRLGVLGEDREADLARLLGLDRPREEDHLFEAGGAEGVGQAGVVGHREAVADGAGDRHAELGVRGDHAQVAGGGDGQAGAHREAVHQRDRRLAHGLQAVEHLVDPGLVDEPVLGGLEVGELADVGAGDEGPAARAAQDHDLHVVVGVDGLAVLDQAVVHREGHRVVGLGAVEGDPGGLAADLVGDVSHPALSGSRRCAGRAAARGGGRCRASR